MQERLVVGVRSFRQVAVETGAEQPFAVIAVADAQRMAAVVGGGIAEHVEEQTVDVVALQRLGQDLGGLLAIPAAIHTGLVEAVVRRGLAIGFLEEPFGMGLIHIAMSLAEVEAPDDPDAAGMTQLQDLAKRVAAPRYIRTDIVVLHLARIECRDAPHGHQQGVALEIRNFSHKFWRIERRVVLAQVGLHPANRLLHPPAGFGGEDRRQKDAK